MTEISINELMKARFAAGHGVVTLAPTMTDEQILQMVKLACVWSQGKAFSVIPPSPTAQHNPGKPHGRLRRKVLVGIAGAVFGAAAGYGMALTLSAGADPAALGFTSTGFTMVFGAVIFSAVFAGAYSGFCDGLDKPELEKGQR